MDLTKYGITGNVVSTRAQGAVDQLFDKIDETVIGSPVVSADVNFGLTFEWVDKFGGTLIARFFQDGESELFHLHRANGMFARSPMKEDGFIAVLGNMKEN